VALASSQLSYFWTAFSQVKVGQGAKKPGRYPLVRSWYHGER
jgi:hypothetical protein